MNIRQLQHFLALLDHGSLCSAADAVHLSLPALSRSIQAMEKTLGVPLFDRNARRLHPTPYAWAYEPRARRIVLDEKEGARTLSLMLSGEAGSLAFGMGSSLAPLLLGPTVLDLMRSSPKVQVRSVIETSDRLLSTLLAERLDFFVGDTRVAYGNSALAVESIYPCTFSWYARRDHPLTGKKQIEFKELLTYPMLAGGYFEPSLAAKLSELYKLATPVIDHFAFVSDDIGAVRDILHASDAVMPSTDIAMLSSLENGEVAALDVRPPLEMHMALGIVRHAEQIVAPVAERAFVAIRERLTAVGLRIAEHKAVRGCGRGQQLFEGRHRIAPRPAPDSHIPM